MLPNQRAYKAFNGTRDVIAIIIQNLMLIDACKQDSACNDCPKLRDQITIARSCTIQSTLQY